MILRRTMTFAVFAATAMTETNAAVAQSPPFYAEKYRPQFHFTSQTDWLNDPNGLVFYDGEYHLFFQRAPGSTDGNAILKSWGHAISSDLVHWTQLPDALSPDANGSIWSGSAVVDWHNTSGFGKDGKPPLIAFYTNAKTPFDQRLAYSTDRGRTWTKYSTPILANIHGQNRDPKVIWHEGTKRWVMALYLDEPSHYALFTSPDCKAWTKLQDVTLEGDNECPDIFELGPNSRVFPFTSESACVFTGASARYMMGSFDLRGSFVPSTESLQSERGPGFYAAQTYSDAPNDRRIQIGWMRGGRYPGMPFNQQMSFPCELTSRSTPRGIRLFRWPVRQIESLYIGKPKTWHAENLESGHDLLEGMTGDLLDIDLEFVPGDAKSITLNVRGTPITWHSEAGTGGALTVWDRRASLQAGEPMYGRNQQVYPGLYDGRVRLRVIVDRTCLEIFATRGEVVMSGCFVPPDDDHSIKLTAAGDGAEVVELTIHELKSAWPTTAPTTQP